MIIDGKKISRTFGKEDASDYYYSAIKREVSQAINRLPFARIVKVEESNTTSSLYFKVRLKHFEEPITVSIRTHIPRRSADYMLSFYINKYKSISDLSYDICLKLTQKYNVKAEYLLLNPYQLPSRNKDSKPKKRKKIIDEGERNSLLEKAYRYEELPNGWAELVAVTQTLGSTFKVTKEQMGVNKLSKAYINSDLYLIKEEEINGRVEKLIKLKDSMDMLKELK